MAFRRPGIRILERDEAGNPTVAQVIPFDERVVQTPEGPRLLKDVRRIGVRTSQFIDRDRDGVDDRDQLTPIRDRPAPVVIPSGFRPRVKIPLRPLEEEPAEDPTEVEPAFRLFGPPLLRCAPGFHVEFGGTRSQRCVPDDVNGDEPGDLLGRIRDRPAPVVLPTRVTVTVNGDEDGEPPREQFPTGDVVAESETMVELDAVSDATQLPNGGPAGIGESSFAGGGGGGGGFGFEPAPSLAPGFEDVPDPRGALTAIGAVFAGLVGVFLLMAIRKARA